MGIQIDGVTIIEEEIEKAAEARILYKKDYRVFDFNKYNIRNLNILDNDYDLIDDISLKHYACCDKHWREYFNAIIQRIAPGGILITHTQGFHKHSSLPALDMTELEIVCKKAPRHIEISTIDTLNNKHNRCPVVLTVH